MKRFGVATDVACAALAGGTVVLHMRTKRYYSLNESGALVWELVEQQTTEGAAVARLQQIYEVTTAEAQSAVGELLASLAEEELIVEVDE